MLYKICTNSLLLLFLILFNISTENRVHIEHNIIQPRILNQIQLRNIKNTENEIYFRINEKHPLSLLNILEKKTLYISLFNIKLKKLKF